MMDPVIGVVTVGYVIFSSAVFYAFRSHHAAPHKWFLLFHGIMAVGTFRLLDANSAADQAHILCYYLSLIAFTLGAFFGVYVFRPQVSSYKCAREASTYKEVTSIVVVWWFILSLSISVLYFYLVGYNMLFLLLTGGVEDFSTMRLETYAGANYYAPGYINQFKNVLLPVCGAVIVTQQFRAQSRRAWLTAAIVFAFVSMALLGTGQRLYLVYAVLMVAFSLKLIYPLGNAKLSGAGALLIIPSAGGLFLLITSAYAGQAGVTGWGVFLISIERVFAVQQEGALIGFRHIYKLEVAWFGEWLVDLRGILPWHRGSTLAHEIHEIQFGTDRGTVPLSTVGSAYHNGGLIGVFCYFFLLASTYVYLYSRFISKPRSVERCFGYGALFVYLSTYVAGGPKSLVLNGVVALVLFLLLIRVRLQAQRY